MAVSTPTPLGAAGVTSSTRPALACLPWSISFCVLTYLPLAGRPSDVGLNGSTPWVSSSRLRKLSLLLMSLLAAPSSIKFKTSSRRRLISSWVSWLNEASSTRAPTPARTSLSGAAVPAPPIPPAVSTGVLGAVTSAGADSSTRGPAPLGALSVPLGAPLPDIVCKNHNDSFTPAISASALSISAIKSLTFCELLLRSFGLKPKASRFFSSSSNSAVLAAMR